MAKKNSLSFKAKMSYALSKNLGMLLADSDTKKNILDFFFSREYKEIAFCNVSKITRPIILFLQRNNINIKYIVSNDVGDSFLGYKVYRKNRWNIPSVDTIIVMPSQNTKHNNKLIKSDIERLDKYVSCPVYSVFELFKSTGIIKNIKKNYMFYRDLDPKYYPEELCSWYKRRTGRELDLENPHNYSEKVQWLKLYDNTEIKTTLSDKYLSRDWVKATIGEQYLIPLLGVYDRPEDIDWKALPNEFVIKCNHGSGYNIVVEDKTKLNIAETVEKLGFWLSQNYAFYHGAGLELQYKNIKPKVIIEKKIKNDNYKGVYNFQFWCINGNTKYVRILSDKNYEELKTAFYSPTWEKQDFYTDNKLEYDIPKPENLELMINLADKLASEFKFVRVDLYRLDDGSIYFGEMTFTPGIGLTHWSNESINDYIGELMVL